MKTFRRILVLTVAAGLLQPLNASVPAQLDWQSALQLAMENNYSLRRAQATVEEAGGQTMSARSGRMPSVSLNAAYSRLDDNLLEDLGGNAFGDTESWNTGVQASQPLFTGGAIKAGIESAEALELSEQANYDQVTQDTMLRLHQAWYAVLLAKDVVTVREESIDLLEKQLKITSERFDAGTVSRFEVLRAEVALANGKPPLIRARNQYRLAIVDLLQVIGLESDESAQPEIIGELTYPDTDPNLSDALYTAKRNRPEFRSIDQAIVSADANVRSVRSGKRPNVNLVAGYGIQKSSFSDSFDDSIHGWTVGVQGSWKIWDSKSTDGQVISAKSRLRQLELARQELDLQVGSQVRQALSSVQEARELVESSRKVVEQASEVLVLAEDRYAIGSAIQLEVYEAELALTEARTNEIQALHDFNLALAAFERATGTITAGLL
ncbi:MAG: TolC family protein [Puniceicoccaceae bacterium]